MFHRCGITFGLFWLTMAACRASEAEEVTFNKDVAPILWNHCAACHRQGQIGPFSLLKYQDAAKRADFHQRDRTRIAACRPGRPSRVTANSAMSAA